MVFFFFKQKTAYDIMPSLVGSEMCIRDSGCPGDEMAMALPSSDRDRAIWPRCIFVLVTGLGRAEVQAAKSLTRSVIAAPWVRSIDTSWPFQTTLCRA